MKRILIFILTLTLLPLGWYGCQKDPCEGQPSPLTANFLIYDQPPYRADPSLPNIKFDTDTVYWHVVTFEALDEQVEYFWEIGEGTYTKKKFTLHFEDKFRTRPIEVKLTTKRKFNATCPGDTSKTTTRTFVFSEESLMDGKFNGYLTENPNKKFTINIRRYPSNYWPNGLFAYSVENFLGNGCAEYFDPFVSSRVFYHMNTFGPADTITKWCQYGFENRGEKVKGFWGYWILSKDGSELTMDFLYQDQDNLLEHWRQGKRQTFKGKRIQ